MRWKRHRADHARVDAPARRDLGATLVEILIAIVLLGTVVVTVVAGLLTAVTASALDRDHANAHAWLQTAADMLYARDLDQCDPSVPAATEIANTIAEYESTLQQTENPEGWGSANIQIIDLEWWSIDIDPTTGIGTEAWGTQCDSGDTNLQKVVIQVTAEDGRIVESVEVIIGE